MGAFLGVSHFFKRPLYEVARDLGYGEDNILILQGNEYDLVKNFPETYYNMKNCFHHRDRRTALEYAQDLVASWLMEDYFLNLLRSDSYEIQLDGADRNRKILPSAKTSASSDFLITRPGFQIKLELMNDYTGFWKENQVLHLRDAKYIQLQNTHGLFIAIAVPSNEFAIFDFRDTVPARFIPSHRPYGGKSAYELPIPPAKLRPITDSSMSQAIIDLLGLGIKE